MEKKIYNYCVVLICVAIMFSPGGVDTIPIGITKRNMLTLVVGGPIV
jgi:hypothetical protein